MRVTRIFHDGELVPQAEIELTPEASNHLLRVLRLTMNAPLVIFNGKGGQYNATISQVSKKTCRITLNEFIKQNIESPLITHLAQGIARGDQMDLIIQKSVELGITTITPLLTQYSEGHLSRERLVKRLHHWRQIAIHACEQCGRNILPAIEEPQTFGEVLSEKSAVLKLILHPHVRDPLPALVSTPKEVMTMIGPEGGFSETEIDLALRHGFQAMSFGPRILRMETAAISLLSVVQYLWGDLKR